MTIVSGISNSGYMPGIRPYAAPDSRPAAPSTTASAPIPAAIADLAPESTDAIESIAGFLYAPGGRPEGAYLPAASVSSAESSAAVTRDPPATLAMESTQLTALLASLMTRPKSSEETRTLSAPAEKTDATQPPAAQVDPVIVRLYQQF
ncbi:MAG: hypothetical protein QHC90_16345 [Shinella sp.]|nr:hypothetical protein [Shinella sp.]